MQRVLSWCFGLLLVAVFTVLYCQPLQVFGQRGGVQALATAELITHSTVHDKYQLLTVIDPRSKAVSVYQIDLVSGVITLKSARNLTWDLQLVEFNSANPLPREIRTLLEQK